MLGRLRNRSVLSEAALARAAIVVGVLLGLWLAVYWAVGVA